MTRNRVMQATALAAILLAFGLAGCGGSEPAPVATPPAPPPAPPPFQPAPVEVALGELGGTATLMTKEGGGFTLNGEDFTGGNVEGDNGMTYALTLTDGSWSAAHVPMEVGIELGTSGGMVTLSQGEDGTSYTVVGSTGVVGVALSPTGVPQGAQALNGNQYVFANVDGVWMATFLPPAPVAVGLGMSGESVHVQMQEDGSYMIGDMALMDGDTVSASNGNMYTLSMMEGGWMASYSAMTQEVTLGMTGEMVTVTKAEDGSYWLDDAELMSGGMTMSSNGNDYTLTMDADGNWMAAFAPRPTMTVALGTSGGSVMVNRNENGSYTVVGLSMVSGSTIGENGLPSSVTASNGNMYSISEMDGAVTAEFMAPAPVMVALGMSGETVSIQVAEDGSYWLGDMAVSDGETVSSSDGASYTLSMVDGMWMATFMGDSVNVMLSMHGGSVTVVTAEDGTYWVGDMELMDGGMVYGEGGRSYTLMMGEDGMWTATYVMPDPVTVALGSAGSVTLQQIEDGSWWHGDAAVADGSTVEAGNGASYQLMLADGVWSASYQGVLRMIEGTGLTAVMLEDGSGYDVEGATLPASGMGDIMVAGASYNVWMDDGQLKGARNQALAWDDSTDKYLGDFATGTTGNPANQIGFVADDEDTPQNEARTGLIFNDVQEPNDTKINDTFPMSELLGSGISEQSGTNFVSKAREEIEKIRVKAAALFEAFSGDGQGDMLRGALDDLWKDELVGDTLDENTEAADTGAIEDQLIAAFGAAGTTRSWGAERPDADDFLEEIDKILEALSSVEGLEAAAGEDGVFENLLRGTDMTAEQVFEANRSEATMTFGVSGGSSYGAVSKKERADALTKDLSYADADVDATDTVETDAGRIGAFAYSTMNDTLRNRYVQSSGNAYYEGGTAAVTGNGKHYAGDIQVQIRFATDSVSGLVTNLANADGEPWSYNFRDVDAIVLDGGTLRQGAWAATGTTATVAYSRTVGTAGSQPAVQSTFAGELVGGSGATAGDEAVGVWSVGAQTATGSASYIVGGFAAMRGEDLPDERPSVDDGTGVESMVDTPDREDTAGTAATTAASRTAKTKVADGKLTVTVDRYAWVLDNDPDGGVSGIVTDSGADPATATIALANYQKVADVDDDDDDMESERSYEISLASLFANQGSEQNTNGDKWSDLARTEIERIRTSLATLLQLDGDFQPAVQADLWRQFQNVVGSMLFRAWDPDNVGQAGDLESTDIAAAYNKNEALEVIDDVLNALSSAANLDDALDEDGGGVFTDDDGDPIFTDDTAAEILNERDSQVRAWLGSTDYTRFGMWRVRRTRNALRSNLNFSNTGDQWADDASGVFAYSPLAEAKYANGDPGYPSGGNATYTGETLAWASNPDTSSRYVALQGTIELIVAWGTWNSTGDAIENGTVTAVISDLTDTDGDPLRWIDTSTPPELHPVAEIVIRSAPINNTTSNELRFSTPTGQVAYDSNRLDVTSTSGLTGATLDGTFLGRSLDGPLAVIGRWTTTGLNHEETARNFIEGSFGAELP